MPHIVFSWLVPFPGDVNPPVGWVSCLSQGSTCNAVRLLGQLHLGFKTLNGPQTSFCQARENTAEIVIREASCSSSEVDVCRGFIVCEGFLSLSFVRCLSNFLRVCLASCRRHESCPNLFQFKGGFRMGVGLTCASIYWFIRLVAVYLPLITLGG